MNAAIEYFFFLLIMIAYQVQANDFVYDYFLDRSVSRVMLFSCEQTEFDFHFVKNMNGLGIAVAINHPISKLGDISDQISRKEHSPFGLFLDTRCQTQTTNGKIIAQASDYRLYEGLHVWLVLGSSLEHLTDMLNDTAYSLMTDLVIGVKTTIGYDLYDIYNPCKIRGGKMNVTSLGTWTHERGLQITLNQSKFVRRSNLHGLTLKVVGVIKYRPPGMAIEDYLQDFTTKSKDPLTKFGYSILQHLADLYNFTMKIKAVDEFIVTINNTEVGAMPVLYRGEADISASVASAVLRYGAKPYGRMVGPAYPYRTFFVFRSHQTNFKWTELLTPFAIDSWYVAILTAILSIIIITTIQMTEYDERWLIQIGRAIFATIGVFCMQGLVVEPNRLAGRIAFLFLLIMGVLLSNYYGASVVSARLSQPPDKMNDSLYSLAKSQMTLASEAFRNIDDVIKDRGLNEWEVHYFYENVWNKLSSSKYVSPEIGLEKVLSSDYAYHTSAEVAYPHIHAHWNEKAICEMTEVTVVTPRILAVWERSDSPFSEIMRSGLFKMINTGLRTRGIKRWQPKAPYCSPVVQSLQSVTFFEIAPAVIVVIIGIVVAAIICFVENIIYTLLAPNLESNNRRGETRRWGKVVVTK